MLKWKGILILAIAICVYPCPGQAKILRITNVFCNPVIFEPDRGETVKLTYRLSNPATVMIKIYDSRNSLVRELGPSEINKAGDNVAAWDGKDNAGKIVPPNFYLYTITATSIDGKRVVHDLTDLTGGKVQKAINSHYDYTKKAISYVLPGPSIVNIRLGLTDGGPLLATLIDWVPRKGGLNEESWDGWDQSRMVNMLKNKNLQIDVSAYSLPRNCIIVEGVHQKRPAFITKVSWDRDIRTAKTKIPKEMYNHWQHPRDKCYDPTIRLVLPSDLPRNEEGLPVIQGPVPLRMEVVEEDLAFMLDQRFEVGYFIDFIFIYEEALGYTPFTWTWNPAEVGEGTHYITVMLWGYEGHFGTATEKVLVKTGSN